MEKDLTQKGQFLRCLIRLGGGGLTPNETLSHSNGKFVFDHGPYCVSINPTGQVGLDCRCLTQLNQVLYGRKPYVPNQVGLNICKQKL